MNTVGVMQKRLVLQTKEYEFGQGVSDWNSIFLEKVNIPRNSGHIADNEGIEVATAITGTWRRVGTRICVDATIQPFLCSSVSRGSQVNYK